MIRTIMVLTQAQSAVAQAKIFVGVHGIIVGTAVLYYLEHVHHQVVVV